MNKLFSCRLNLWFVLAALGSLCPQVGAKTTRTVTTLQDGVAGSLRQLIQASEADDIIAFSIVGTARLTNELIIRRNLTIIGPGKGLTISGNNNSRVFNIAGATVNISGLTVANGLAPAGVGGGGITNGGLLTLDRCTIWYNRADFSGGGIANYGTLIMGNCTICGNTTSGDGGGIYNNAFMTANNCTFTHNQTTTRFGGAIFNDVLLDLNNCTIAGNIGSGLYAVPGQVGRTVKIFNTIIAGNINSPDPSRPDVFGVFFSQGGNFIGVSDGSTGWGGTDQTGDSESPRDPLLGPLANNGGPTFTMMPQPSSGARDRGSLSVLGPPYSLMTDQRDFPRRIGFSVDVGAVEFDPAYSPGPATSTLGIRAFDDSIHTTRILFEVLCLDQGNMGFVGSDPDGQQSLYFAPRIGPITVAVNTNTSIPGGTGNFLSLPSGPCISGEILAFIGDGVAGQQGVYVKALGDPCRRVADFSTAIPAGVGNFVSFPRDPVISGDNVAFAGDGANGQQGVYLKTPPDPIKVLADVHTAIPDGSGNFTGFPDDRCALVGESVAFIGDGGGGQEGVYLKLQDNPIWTITNTNTPIPGSSNTFVGFFSAAFDGSMVAFAAYGQLTYDPEAGTKGVRGVYKTAPGGAPFKVADDHTPIPGGTGLFTGFSDVAIDAGAVAFLGWHSRPRFFGDPPAGIYTDLGGVLSKVIGVGDTVNGKMVKDLRFSSLGFSQGQVAFVAIFDDESQAIMKAALCVDAPQTGPDFLVTTTDDHNDGLAGTCDCTLREAILAAHGVPGPATIKFAADVTGTISLVLGELTIQSNVTISGPGANALAISGSHTSRVFNLSGTEPINISGLTLRDGMAAGANSQGGAILNASILTLSHCAVLGNVCLGAFGSDGAPGTLGSPGTDGSPGKDALGGAVYNAGILKLLYCTFAQNEARGGNGGRGANGGTVGRSGGAGGQGRGGAICNDGALFVTNCTFSANQVYGGYGGSGGGGAVFDGDGGNGGNAEGAGVFNQAACFLGQVTLVQNVAERGVAGHGDSSGQPGITKGGGIRSLGNSTCLSSTLVALNTLGTGGQAGNGADFFGFCQSQGYNLIGSPIGSTGWTNQDILDQNGFQIDPHLGRLADNGGPTLTHALLPGSPAIDKGSRSALGTDQRGRPRPSDNHAISNATGGDGSDIGAFELSPLQLVVSNTNDSGSGSLRQAIVDASISDNDLVTFASNVTGMVTLTSGRLSFEKSVTIAGPGARLLSLRANGLDSVCDIRAGSVAISGLNLTHGMPYGIYIEREAELALNECAISSNNGCAIINYGVLVESNCAVFGNSSLAGGGLCNYDSGYAYLVNTTISGNFGQYGGGIYNGSSNLFLANCTIAENDAISGGGVSSFYPGRVSSLSSIIAGNRAALNPDVSGLFTQSSYNLIGKTNGSAGLAEGVNQNQAGSIAFPLLPLLAPLADYGGSTPSQMLLPGSPALDGGRGGGLNRDQRGRSRPYDVSSALDANGGDASDIGAVEWSPAILNIARSGSQAVVSWPETERLYRLESLSNLGGTSAWSPDNTPRAISGGSNILSEIPAANRKFYRLAFTNDFRIISNSLTQNFEIATPVNYTLSQLVSPTPAAVQSANSGSSGRFLRLLHDGVNDDVNAITFTQTAPGLWPSIQAEFDFRLTSFDSPADGFAFMLIPTARYGTNGPGDTAPIAFEEPNIPGVFAVGFDVFPHGAPDLVNDVSIHWDGLELVNSRIDPATIDLASGYFHHCKVILAHVPGGAVVAVRLTPNINTVPGTSRTSTVFVPGLSPFDCRVEFAGRTGGLNMSVDIDNINVLFTTDRIEY